MKFPEKKKMIKSNTLETTKNTVRQITKAFKNPLVLRVGLFVLLRTSGIPSLG